jgi:hypothetical protein
MEAICVVCHCSIWAAIHRQTTQHAGTGGDAMAQEGMDDNNILFKAVREGDDTLHVDNTSGECGMGNCDILAMGEGDDALPTNDDNGAL